MNPATMPGFGDVQTWGACAGHHMDPRTEYDEDAYTAEQAQEDAELETRRNPYALTWGLQEVLLADGASADAVDLSVVMADAPTIDSLDLGALFALLNTCPAKLLPQVRDAWVSKLLALPSVRFHIELRAEQLLSEAQ